MADPATDPFPTSADSASSYLTAPDVPSKAPDTRGDNVIDLFPTKKQVEGATTALTDIQEHKIKEEDVLLRSFNQRDEQNRARMEQAFKAQGAEIGQLKPWNATEELGKRETSLWEQFGSPGFLIAMMGSAFSATPMNSALSAGGAAIQALNKGKMDDYQRSFDAWKQNTDLVIKRQQIERELYEEIDHLRASDMAAWNAKAAAIMTRFDDTRKLAMLQNGMGPEVLQAIDSEAKAAGDMAKVRDDLDARNRMIQYVNTLPEWKKGDPAAMQRALAEYNDPSNPKIKAFNAFMDQYYQENGASPPPDKIQEWQTQWSMAEKLGQFRGADAPLWERATAMFPGDAQKQADWVAEEKQKGKPASALTINKQDAGEVERRKLEYVRQGMSPAEAFDKAKKEVKQAGVSALDDETVNAMARQYLAGDKSVFQNLGRGAQGAENVIRIRQAVERNAKAEGLSGEDIALRIAEFNALTAGERTLGTRTANVEMFVNEARNQMQVARRLSQEVPRGEFVPLNRALLAFESNTGDPKVVAFGAAINTLVNTYAKAIAGGGQATVSDKDHAREILLSAYTQEQFDAVLDVLDQEMEAAREAPRQVKQQFRDLAHGDKLGGIPTPDRSVIKYDAEGNRVQ